jgi:hypothetical protein
MGFFSSHRVDSALLATLTTGVRHTRYLIHVLDMHVIFHCYSSAGYVNASRETFRPDHKAKPRISYLVLALCVELAMLCVMCFIHGVGM